MASSLLLLLLAAAASFACAAVDSVTYTIAVSFLCILQLYN